MAKLETAPNVDAGVISEETKNAMIMKERKANSPWRKFIRNKSAVVGLIIVVFMMGIGFDGPRRYHRHHLGSHLGLRRRYR